MTDLSKRLQAVADMVSPGLTLADIGTDHGYVPIYLVATGRIPSAVAMDINEGPLQRAKEHIEQEGLDNKIKVRRSDGLKNLKEDEAQTIIAAGMGGGLVIQILSEGKGEEKGVREYILQPQSEIKKVRTFLFENGYRIVAEDMILEEGKYYPVIKAIRGIDLPYSEEELEYGRFLLKNAHPVLLSFLEKEKEKLERITGELKCRKSLRAEERTGELQHRIDTVDEVLRCYFR